MKRAISIILVVLMIAVMIPGGVLAADTEAQSYVYNFTDTLHLTEGGTGTKPTIFSAFTLENFASATSDKWGVVGASVSNAASNAWVKDGYFWYRPKAAAASMTPVYSPGVELNTETSFTAAVTMAIVVGQDGTYTPSITLTSDKSSPIWEVFLTETTFIDEGISHSGWVQNKLDSSDRLGTINGYGSGESVSANFINTELKKGTYYLTLVSNGKDEAFEYYDSADANNPCGVNLYLNLFKLKNIDEVETSETYSYNITSDALKDPTTASNYTIASTSTQLTQLKESVLNQEATSPYSVAGYRYNYKSSSLGENGLSYSLYGNRHTYNDNNQGSNAWIAFELHDLKEGTYNLSLLNELEDTANGCHTSVFFYQKPSDWTDPSSDADNNVSRVTTICNTTNARVGVHSSQAKHTAENPEALSNVNVEIDGDYILLFVLDGPAYNNNSIDNPETADKDESASAHEQFFYLSGIKLEPVAVEDTELVAAQAKYDAIKKAQAGEIKTAVASGLSDTAAVNVITTEVNGDEQFENGAKKITGNVGDTITVTADPIDGYDFLYWAKGLGSDRQGVSDEEEYTFKATSGGGIWLTAVYKSKASTDVPVVFYNGNGEEVGRDLVPAGDMITMPATLPSLEGHPASTGWALGSKDNIFDPGDTVEASGKRMYFVAQFPDPEKDTITVTVDGKEYGKYAYGEKVTVEATERENGSGENVFVYWKKGDEIVSFDKSYTFTAYENCSLTAYYDFYKPLNESLRKIIIKEDGEKLWAEFIGLDTAVEKGIIFNKDNETNVTFANASHKIAMSTSGNQLTATNNVGSYIGYAILSDGTVIYDK